MLIEVTQKDIDLGLKRSCLKCPVAIALSRALGKTIGVGISGYWTATKEYTDLPDKVNKWIQDFDTGYVVKPFCFEV